MLGQARTCNILSITFSNMNIFYFVVVVFKRIWSTYHRVLKLLLQHEIIKFVEIVLVTAINFKQLTKFPL